MFCPSSGLGNGGLIVASHVAVQSNFDKKRAFATGIAMMGGSIGGFTFTPILRLLVDYLGWRGAIVIQSALVLQSVVLGALQRPVIGKNTGQEKTKQLSTTNTTDNVGNEQRENTSATAVENTSDTTVPKYENQRTQCKLCDTAVLKIPMFLVFMLATNLCSFGITTMYQHTSSRAVVKNIDKFESALLPSAIGVVSTCFRFITSVVSNLKCTNRSLYYALVSFGGGVVICLSCLTSSLFLGSIIMAGVYGAFLGKKLYTVREF